MRDVPPSLIPSLVGRYTDATEQRHCGAIGPCRRGGSCIRGQQLLVERPVVNGTSRHEAGGPGQETFGRGGVPPALTISLSLSLSPPLSLSRM